MYYLKTSIFILFLLISTFAYAESSIESCIDKSQVANAEQYAENDDSQPSDETAGSVCQSDADRPCCCNIAGRRVCTSKSDCSSYAGKCTTSDPRGDCP